MIKPTVFIVDDEEAVRDSLQWLLESKGLKVALFDSAETFLASYTPDRAGCLVVDVRMPGMSGLELQEKLAEWQYTIPVIFITGHGDVPMAVQAVKHGAVDFLEKPFNDKELLAIIDRSLTQDRAQREGESLHRQIRDRLASLSPRERAVLDLVVAGRLNKQIADELAISIKTVEAHRANMMDKMGAQSLAELVQQVLAVRDGG